MACWLANYPEWLQFCWDFVKPPRNDEMALQHFFLACSSARFFFYFICATCNFFLPTTPPPPQELNGRPLILVTSCKNRQFQNFVIAWYNTWTLTLSRARDVTNNIHEKNYSIAWEQCNSSVTKGHITHPMITYTNRSPKNKSLSENFLIRITKLETISNINNKLCEIEII